MLLPLLLLACPAPVPGGPLPSPPPAPAEAPPPPAWPDSPLRVLPTPPVHGTLVLDAGHGAEGNPGNSNWRCEAEGDVMRRVTDAVAEHLAGAVAVTRTRPTAALVDYSARLRAANRGDWFISLHSDTRAGVGLHADAVSGCWQNTGATGVAVLWSDEGEPALVARRHALAQAIATRTAEAGFPPYPGLDYGGLYDPDAVPGVFVDRHEDRKRIMLLRRPKVPSVIVETHEAWDVAEATRWDQPDTWAAFAAALGAALADVEATPGLPSPSSGGL